MSVGTRPTFMLRLVRAERKKSELTRPSELGLMVMPLQRSDGAGIARSGWTTRATALATISRPIDTRSPNRISSGSAADNRIQANAAAPADMTRAVVLRPRSTDVRRAKTPRIR